MQDLSLQSKVTPTQQAAIALAAVVEKESAASDSIGYELTTVWGEMDVTETATDIATEAPTANLGTEVGATESGSTDDGEGGAASIEWDHKGRVIRASFSGGNVAQYKYDTDGNLYAFVYARLAWSLCNGKWTAKDATYQYVIDGNVAVEYDGTLKIEKSDVTRTLKLSGSRFDDYANGTKLQSHRIKREASPADLLAVSRPITVSFPKLSGQVQQTCATDDATGVKKSDADGFSKTVQLRKIGGETGQEIAQPERKVSGERLRVINQYTEAPSTSVKEALRTYFEESVAKCAISLIEHMYGPEHRALTLHIDCLAQLRKEQRFVDEAERLHERSMSIKQMQFGGEHESIATNMYGLATIYHGMGRYEDAEKAYLESIRLLENSLEKYKFFVAAKACTNAQLARLFKTLLTSLDGLGQLYVERKKADLCVGLHQRAKKAWAIVQPQDTAPLHKLIESIANRRPAGGAPPAAENTGRHDMPPHKPKRTTVELAKPVL